MQHRHAERSRATLELRTQQARDPARCSVATHLPAGELHESRFDALWEAAQSLEHAGGRTIHQRVQDHRHVERLSRFPQRVEAALVQLACRQMSRDHATRHAERRAQRSSSHAAAPGSARCSVACAASRRPEPAMACIMASFSVRTHTWPAAGGSS